MHYSKHFTGFTSLNPYTTVSPPFYKWIPPNREANKLVRLTELVSSEARIKVQVPGSRALL